MVLKVLFLEMLDGICDGLGFLGITLAEASNEQTPGVISTDSSRVPVRVIRTDEKRKTAMTACRILGLDGKKEN